MKVSKEYISRLASEVRSSITFILRVVEKPFEDISEAEKYAIRYHLITIAEALTSIALHVCREVLNQRPETPIHAFKLLVEGKVISNEVFMELSKFMGLRNLLVHRYWVINDENIYENIKGDFKCVEEFLKNVLALIGGEV
ncbi:MAG: DUF86 domain-containing protein [Candidatus Verstraetearchaeota archaeon]|nr:DUF86 domain-containing protein [Candidatus Verstraetearchaeota archaeon]